MFMAAGSSKPGGSHVQDPGNGAVPIDGVKPLFLLQVNRQDQVRKRVAPIEKHGGRAGGQIFFDAGCVRQANGNVVLPAPVEVRFCRCIETKICKPTSARNSRYPVLFKTLGRFWTNVPSAFSFNSSSQSRRVSRSS